MKNLLPKLLLLSICTMLLASLTSAAPERSSLPTEKLHLLLLENMKQGQHQLCPERLEKLLPLLGQTFDIEFIARQVLRQSWNTMTREHQSQFIALLEQQVALSYAQNFDAYAGESFIHESFVAEDETQIAKHLVIFQRPDKASLQFEYVLRSQQDSWRIANIVVDGVSDLALRSAQYRTAIRDGGVTHLLDTLTDKVEQAHKKCEEPLP